MADKITQIAQAGNAIILTEPGAGEVIRVELSERPLEFQFNLDSATFALEGNDLVITFANGGQIIVEDYVTDAPLGGGTIVAADGSELVPADIATRLEGARVVQQPGEGEVTTLQVAENDAFIFDFDPISAEIQVDGDNMILVFPDGGRIVLEGFFAPGGESGYSPLTLLSDGSLLSGDLITALAVEPAAGPAAQTDLEGPTGGEESGGGEFEAPSLTEINSIDPLDPIGNEEFGATVPDGIADPPVEEDNEVPVARDNAYQTTEDGPPIAVAPDGILGNDSDPDGDPLTVVDAGAISIASVTLQSAPNGFDDSDLGTLSVGADGSLNYSPSANFQALGNGEQVVMTFVYTASDGEAETNEATVTITVTGLNDAPVIEIGEGDSARDEVVEFEDLDQTDGADDANEGGLHEVDGTLTFSDPDVNDGHTVSNITPAAGGYLGSFDASVTTPTTDGEGGVISWDFSVQDSALDYLAVGETLVQTYEIELSDGEGGFDTFDVVVTIEGTNDGPSIVAGDSGQVDELADGAPQENAFTHELDGVLDFSDEDLSDSHLVSFTPQDGGYLGTFSVTLQTDTTGSGTGGEIAWSFEVEDSAIDYLGEGETLVQTYTVEVDDQNGGTHTRDVVVTIVGANDEPVITVGEGDDDSGDITEIVDDDTTDGLDDPDEGGPLNATGTLSFSDADHQDDGTHSVTNVTDGGPGYIGVFDANVTTDTTDGAGGEITWTFDISDADIDYLGEGEEVNQSYTIELSDGSGGTTTQQVDITITGENDGPVITSGPASETITELPDGDPDENTFLHQESGSFDFTDVDLIDSHTVDYTPQAGGYLGTFSVSLDTDTTGSGTGGVIDWDFQVSDADLDSLGVNDSLEQVYVVTVDDGEGGTHTQTVTITITGANNVPDASPDTNFIVEGTVSKSGEAIDGQDNGSYLSTDYEDQADTDADGQDLDVSAISGSGATSDNGTEFEVQGTYGVLTIDKETGAYTYELGDVESLNQDELVTDTFNYTVTDGSLSDSSTIVIDIYGLNDDPMAENDTHFVLEDGGVINGKAIDGQNNGSFDGTDYADVADTDVDSAADLDIEAITGSGSTTDDGPTFTVAGTYGELVINKETGDYSYTLDNSLDAVQELDLGDMVQDVFNYTVGDGLATDNATITIDIYGQNDDPMAANDTHFVLEDGGVINGKAIDGQNNGSFDGTNYADVADTDADASADLDIQSITGDGSTSDGGTTFTVAGTYGELVINKETGDYSYTLDNSLDAVQELDDGDMVQDVFNYTVTDGISTDAASITIDIYGQNDTPTISANQTKRVSEEGFDGTTAYGTVGLPDTDGSSDTTNLTQQSGQFTVDDPDADASLTVTLSEPVGSYSSNGDTVTWTGDGTNQLIGSADGVEVIRITIDNTGAYTVLLSGPFDHTEGDDIEGDNVSITTVVTVSDGTASATSNLTVIIEDDSPEMGTPDQIFLSNVAGNEATGFLDFAYGGDGPGSITFDESTLPELFANGGQEVEYQVTGNVLVAYTDNDDGGDLDPGEEIFTVTLDPSTNSYTFELNGPGLLESFEETAVGEGTSFGAGPNSFYVIPDSLDANKDVALISGYSSNASFGSVLDFTNAFDTSLSNYTDAQVNLSTAGYGVDNNNLNDDQMLLLDFNTESFDVEGDGDTNAGLDFSGPSVFAVDVSFSSGGDTIYWAAYNESDVLLDSGSLVTVKNQVETFGDLGDEISYILIYGADSNTKVNIISLRTLDNTGTVDFVLDVEGEDADGDAASGSIALTVDGSGTLLGSAGDDVLSGAGSSPDFDGNDTMTGNGGADIFYWAGDDFEAGTNDIVTDFMADDSLDVGDMLDATGDAFDPVADVNFDGADTVLTFNDGPDTMTITLQGVNLENMLQVDADGVITQTPMA